MVLRRSFTKHESENREQLKRKIIAAFDTVKSQEFVLRRVKDNHRRRAELCVQRGGGHFEQVLKYA